MKKIELKSIWRRGAAVAVLTATGCGSSQLSRVEGVVTLDGAPLADANVVFSAPGVPMATARTDRSGRYRVVTGGARGMIPGEYEVSIAAYASPKTEGGPRSPRLIIPREYVKPNSSGLTAVIAAGTNRDVNFELATQ